MIPTDRMLTATDVAKVLQCSKSQAYALIKKGVIPSLKFGSLVRVHPKALEESFK